jgi:rubrerythrin
MVAAEYEAVQMYMPLAESTNNELAIEVLKDIANEERVHAGEFLRLLRELAPDEKAFYVKGAKEVEDEIKKTADCPKGPRCTSKASRELRGRGRSSVHSEA